MKIKITNTKRQLLNLSTAASLLALILVSSATPPTARAVSPNAEIYLSPSSQSLTSGGNLVLSVVLLPSGSSINTVQAVITYPAANLSFVSITPGAAFNGAFPNTSSSGKIQFSAGAITAVTTAETVANITLHATTAGNGSISLASICPAGNYALTCSAAYDSVTSNNDLTSAANASYRINAPVTPPPSTPPTSPSTPSTPSTPETTSTGSTSSKSTSSSTKPSTQTTAPPPATVAATTTTSNPAPAISNVTVSAITTTGATISWTTNLPATSAVQYGLTPKYGQIAQSAGLTTNHQITLASPTADLSQGTTYYYQVSSATGTGAGSTSGAEQFNTTGFTVTFTVVDKSGKAIKRATVSFDGQTQTSNNSGQITFQNVPAGPQSVVIKSGTKSVTQSIKVGQRDPKTGAYQKQQFSLTATRSTTANLSWLYVLLILIVAIIGYSILGPGSFGKVLFRKFLARSQSAPVADSSIVVMGSSPATESPEPGQKYQPTRIPTLQELEDRVRAKKR